MGVMSANADNKQLIEVTGEIVAAYVSRNVVRPSELPDLIASVHAALTGLGKPAEPEPMTYTPAVPIRKSITPDHLVSLIDGKPYKSLKRHLNQHGLTPDEYRQRYGLPRDYPMVAAAYAARRSELARTIGLGQRRHAKGGSDEGAAAAE